MGYSEGRLWYLSCWVRWSSIECVGVFVVCFWQETLSYEAVIIAAKVRRVDVMASLAAAKTKSRVYMAA
jgi:hypothetical protein